MEALLLIAALIIAHFVYKGYRRSTHPYEMLYHESGVPHMVGMITAVHYLTRQFVSLEDALDFTATLFQKQYALIHVTHRSSKDGAGYSVELVRDENFNTKYYECSVRGSIGLTSAQLAARLKQSDACLPGVNETGGRFASRTLDTETLLATKPIAIVAIHGTFAPGAPWTSDNSTFASALRAELAEREVSWHAFVWSGGNSHTAREDAARELSTFLVELSSRHAGPIFLVCHSHGGNVALMALLHRPELEQVIAGVACLSTPFFRPIANDYGELMQTAHDSLGPMSIVISAFLYVVIIGALSNKFPELAMPAMAIYVVMLLMAIVTSVALHGRFRKQDQVAVLRKYNYSAIRQQVLAIRATYDEAFHWIGISSLAADSLINVYYLVVVVALIATYLTLGLCFYFVIPLIILCPLILIAGNAMRALIRAAPWTVGERPITSFLAKFATSSVLTIPTALNVCVSVSFDDAHRKLKLRHSALYDSSRVAVIVSRFVKGESLEEYISGNIKA